MTVHPAQHLAKMSKLDVAGGLRELWDHPYNACPITEPEFEGLTYGQVILKKQILFAASGDPSAFDRVLDRMVGKPVQANVNTNISGSYKDFLEEVARQEAATKSTDGAIDAEFKVE